MDKIANVEAFIGQNYDGDFEVSEVVVNFMENFDCQIESIRTEILKKMMMCLQKKNEDILSEKYLHSNSMEIADFVNLAGLRHQKKLVKALLNESNYRRASTVGDLRKITSGMWLRVPRIGQKYYNEIASFLWATKNEQ